MDELEVKSCVIITCHIFNLDDKESETAIRKCPLRGVDETQSTQPRISTCSNPLWTPRGPFDWCDPSKIFFRKK